MLGTQDQEKSFLWLVNAAIVGRGELLAERQ